MGNLYVGTSGFMYYNWIGNFYPEDQPKTKLFNYYIQHFNTVEFNVTFYRTPKEKTVEGWREKAPADFAFVFKGRKVISHYKKLQPDESLDIFFAPFAAFKKDRDKKHLILWQTMHTLKKDVDVLRDFLQALPDYFRHAFEFRHPGWFDDEVYQLLGDHNAAIVLSDSPIKDDKRRWPMEHAETADFFYTRFHGSEALYTSRYTDEELNEYAELMADKLERGIDCYAYFNNDAHGHAPHDAIRLRTKVQELVSV